MNANELANLLEVDSWYKLVTREEIATMLRQQQAEIEALKKEAALQRLSDFTQEADNEPVAWMCKDDDVITDKFKKSGKGGDCSDYNIPLYTHPAKELHLSLQKSKETGELLAVTYTDDEHRIVEVLWKKPPAKTLTDMEILEIANKFKNLEWAIVAFARAILRKAQENG